MSEPNSNSSFWRGLVEAVIWYALIALVTASIFGGAIWWFFHWLHARLDLPQRY
jgi:hypothetical protein